MLTTSYKKINEEEKVNKTYTQLILDTMNN